MKRPDRFRDITEGMPEHLYREMQLALLSEAQDGNSDAADELFSLKRTIAEVDVFLRVTKRPRRRPRSYIARLQRLHNNPIWAATAFGITCKQDMGLKEAAAHAVRVVNFYFESHGQSARADYEQVLENLRLGTTRFKIPRPSDLNDDD